ncbi:MAG TPA: DUF4260 domain-containing protein [Pseudogracilibacillus sp.]|nr:DUF4260 domain-containing protein [Pseudogracilibacillus sp.]
MNKFILHVEGTIVFLLTIYFYFSLQLNWLIFFILLFAPDLAMVGYLKNVKFGSIIYNLVHTYTLPAIMLVSSLQLQHDFVFMLSLIWIAHIGMDRMLGFGLKYPTHFHDTHLNRV